MRSYYRSTLETWEGNVGEAWYEFDGLRPVRQVTQVGERWLSSLDDHDPDVGPLLTDQLLQPGEFSDDEEIKADDFERAWAKAMKARERILLPGVVVLMP
jgi:hypothetical protein